MLSNREIAKYILGFTSMGVAAELPEEEHLESLEKSLQETPKELYDYLSEIVCTKNWNTNLVNMFSQIEVPNTNDTTEYGTKYSDIAHLILAGLDIRTLLDYKIHYNIIVKQLKQSPKELVYYLSDITENM